MSDLIGGFWVQQEAYGFSHPMWVFVSRSNSFRIISYDTCYLPHLFPHPQVGGVCDLEPGQACLDVVGARLQLVGPASKINVATLIHKPMGESCLWFRWTGKQNGFTESWHATHSQQFCPPSWWVPVQVTIMIFEFHDLQLRMVLCILLILSRNSYFLVEQPAQSLLYMHKRWQYLANRICWVPWNKQSIFDILKLDTVIL